MTKGAGILVPVQRPFPRGASGRIIMRPVNRGQRPPIQSFTRETFPRIGGSAGSERATDLVALVPWISSPNCRQHIGEGRHVLPTQTGGPMQRR